MSFMTASEVKQHDELTYFGPQAVTDATDILCRDKTCIILTRRRQTIETADYIILIYHGRILEQGSLNDLLEQRRLFYLLTNLADADEF